MPALYASSATSHLLGSVLAAVGVAAVALQQKCYELEETANLRYLIAINKTNHALQCAETATDNDVLASVMLLALFETLRLHTSSQTQAWNAHVQGGLALVILRGPAQLQSHLGLALFKQVSDSISVYCVQNSKRVPANLRQLTALVNDPKNTNFGFEAIVDDFTNLRADLTEGIATDPTDVFVRAEQILLRLEDMMAMMPSAWSPDIIWATKSDTRVHGNHYLKYMDKAAAQLWNTIWMTKVLLNSMIYGQITLAIELNLTAFSTELTLMELAITARRNATDAADAICASVPAFFLPIADGYSQKPPVDVARGYFLIWPLFVAGSCSLVPNATKEYVIDRLSFIATTLDLPQARRAAVALASSRPFENTSW
ncbi:hypothetical protein LTR22_002145 [Elasticomyces elasticus]|nr:hypothetical protein LTR22_002145 [Elasticomyces elasticus]KAK4933378.1 hypothetical protein LTR49_000372 [Elasticomyces elasticus]KAK5755530.1 hypothetical protein LTS12_014398 [Elasticomyces elasticus]